MPILRRLGALMLSQWGRVLVNLLQVGLVAALSLVTPAAVGWVIDRALGRGEWGFLLPGAALIVAAAMAQGALRYSQRYGAEVVAQRIIYDLRGRLYRHLQSLSFAFFDHAQTGEVMSRLTADVETLRLALGMGVVTGLQHAVTVLGILIVLFAYNWQLALVAVVAVPPLLYVVRRYNTVVRPSFARVQQETARLTAVIQENVSGVRVVRAFAGEDREIAHFEAQNRRLQAESVRAARLGALYGTLLPLITSLATVGILWYGGRLVGAGRLSPGDLVSFNLYMMQLLTPMRMLSWILSIWNRAFAGAERIFEFLDTRPEVAEAPDARPLPRVRGEIRLEGVSFAYEDGAPVLEEIDLHIRPGMKVAVLGLTGSGKSTLVSLIPRFYDPTAGRVLLDGIDVRSVTLESLRRQVGLVFQESFLFSATLKENIAFGRPDATMDEIIAAARAAQIHEFILSLPRGYDTVVGERGVGLSGGQRQRVAIARALLMDTPVVILDESTASVDVETERRIHAAMDRVMEGRTAIVIAQRLSTIRRADLVLVLDRGRIAERGTHDELIQRPGIYRTIYDLQSRAADEGVAAG